MKPRPLDSHPVPVGKATIDPLAVYDAAEVATILRISPAQARASLPGVQVSSRIWRILGATLLDHLTPGSNLRRRAPSPARTAASSPGSNGPTTLEDLGPRLRPRPTE